MRAHSDALLDAAFLEFRVARQISTANGESYIARWRPEASFLFEVGRLGDGDKCGPGCRCSIDKQARYVERDNVERVREFKQKDEPPTVRRLSSYNAAVGRPRKQRRQSSIERAKQMQAAVARAVAVR